MADISADNLEKLEASLPILSAALDQRRLGLSLERAVQATQKFDYQIKRLEALTRTAEVLRELISPRQVDDIKEATLVAEDLGDLMASADDGARVDLVTRDAPSLEREIARFHRAVKEMFERFVVLNFASLNSLGQLLTRMGQTDLGSRLQRIDENARNSIQSSALEWPAKLEILQSERAALQDELRQLASNSDVDAFLLAVGRGQTSLRLVTPAVLRWLEEHDALDRFHVASS